MGEIADMMLVTAAAQRPARMDGTCFYCRQKIGESHSPGCVLVVKTVTVRMTVTYDVKVPADWDKDMIEFHRNGSSWCADSALLELEELTNEKDHCLCAYTKFEYVADVSGPRVDEG